MGLINQIIIDTSKADRKLHHKDTKSTKKFNCVLCVLGVLVV
jgi:hypothetical protein